MRDGETAGTSDKRGNGGKHGVMPADGVTGEGAR
jgi:hypothetical protein